MPPGGAARLEAATQNRHLTTDRRPDFPPAPAATQGRAPLPSLPGGARPAPQLNNAAPYLSW